MQDVVQVILLCVFFPKLNGILLTWILDDAYLFPVLILQELHLNKLNRSVVVCNAAVSACEKGADWAPSRENERNCWS